MAKLYLVRHAQASFGMDNYDKLSDLGLKQSTYIPKHFSNDDKHGISSFYRGDMFRHQETAENSFNAHQYTVIKGLNEFDHQDVLKVHYPDITDKEKVMALVVSQPNPKKFFEDEFEKAMLKWMEEEGTTSYKEPFKIFKERSVDAIQQIIATARKEKHKEVIAVTSGGLISFMVTHVLGVPYSKMIGLNLGVVNTSVTSFVFNDSRITLGYFNNYSHLPKDMVTVI